jgi:hypothetical protein
MGQLHRRLLPLIVVKVVVSIKIIRGLSIQKAARHVGIDAMLRSDLVPQRSAL